MNSKTEQVSRDNHYVPQTLLQRWSLDGTTLFARRLLVSDPRVPEWQRAGFRGLAYQRDLYTSSLPQDEADAFEKWIASDFERPASDAIDKLLNGTRLRRTDWHSLALLFALQDLRTPASFFAQMERWDKELPELLEDTTAAALREWGLQAGRKVEHRRTTLPAENHFAGLFDISVERPDEPGAQAYVRASVTIGRRFWLASIRHLLTGAARVLRDHQWSIAEAEEGQEWPLTDHPALKLNWRGPTDYDFGGGMGVRNTDLLMPVTPHHLLVAEVGRDTGRRITLSPDQAALFRRLLVERAHRWVFATRPLNWVISTRPRLVDRETYEAEADRWTTWHNAQSEAGQ